MAADLYPSPAAKPPPYWPSPRIAHISGVCPAVSWTELARPGGSPGLHKCTLQTIHRINLKRRGLPTLFDFNQE